MIDAKHHTSPQHAPQHLPERHAKRGRGKGGRCHSLVSSDAREVMRSDARIREPCLRHDAAHGLNISLPESRQLAAALPWHNRLADIGAPRRQPCSEQRAWHQHPPCIPCNQYPRTRRVPSSRSASHRPNESHRPNVRVRRPSTEGSHTRARCNSSTLPPHSPVNRNRDKGPVAGEGGVTPQRAIGKQAHLGCPCTSAAVRP